MITWVERFNASFRELTQRDVDVWGEIIKKKFPRLEDGELAGAVEHMGELKRTGKLKYATVEDIVSAIIFRRWQAKVSNAPAIGQCQCCHAGWLVYPTSWTVTEGRVVREIGTEKYHTDGWAMEEMTVPCLCADGRKMLAKFPERSRPDLEQIARNVMRWRQTVTPESDHHERRFVS